MAYDGLTQFYDYADGILSQLSPSAHKQLAREIALKFRASNRKRITAQIEPEGSKFQPRKKVGRIKRKMFTKLQTARYLKMKSTPNSAIVQFTDKVSKLAKVHHYGLRDRVDRDKNIKTVYPKRELLGVTASDWVMVETIVISHFQQQF